MKKHQLTTLATLLLTFFLISNSKAQTIDSLAIVPSNPTTADTIRVICYTLHSYSGCDLTSSSFNINSNTITFFVTHTSGMLPALCNSTDTLTIGILNAGTYELLYHLVDTALQITYDTDTIIFSVQQATGLQLIDNSDPGIEIYPNPFSASTTIFIEDKLLTSPIEIGIYDIFGREIKHLSKIKNTEITLTMDNLACGLYFIRIIRDDKIIDIRKIIIE